MSTCISAAIAAVSIALFSGGRVFGFDASTVDGAVTASNACAVLVLAVLGGCGKSKPLSRTGGGTGGYASMQGSGGTSAGGIDGSASGNGGSSDGGATSVGGTGGRGSGGASTSGNGGSSASGGTGSGGTGGGGSGSDLARGGNSSGTGGRGSGGASVRGGTSGSGTGGRGVGGAAGNVGVGGSGGGAAGNGGIGFGGVGSGGAGGAGGLGGKSGAGGGAGGLGGKGGASGTGGSSVGPLTALANAFCAAARSCCTKSALPMTLDDCETMFPSRVASLALVNKGTATIDTTALASCVAAYNLTATSCTFSALMTGCNGVFVGTKGENDPCGVGGNPSTPGVNECKRSGGVELCVWTEDSSDPTVTGTCHKAPHGKNGDACASSCPSGQDCSADFYTSPGPGPVICFEDDGLYCNWATSTGTCAPIVAQGGSCSDDPSACASTTYCDSAAATPTCKAAGTLGQPCSLSGSACLSHYSCGPDGKCAEPAFAYESTCAGSPPVPY